jgi:hypothetical protein
MAVTLAVLTPALKPVAGRPIYPEALITILSVFYHIRVLFPDKD